MLQKVFVVGRSGCGKTTAVNTIAKYAQAEQIPFRRFKDYEILYEMYKEGDYRFRPAEYKGFEVLDYQDYQVFDEAIVKLANEVPSDYNGIVAIEFARNNYQQAIKKFKMDAQEKAHLLFVDCKVGECIRRIHKRVSGPPTPDSHFVPDDIMLSYFSKDNLDYMAYFGEDTRGDNGKHYKTEFPFLEKVKPIDNTNLSLEAFQRKVESFTTLVVQSYFEECLITL